MAKTMTWQYIAGFFDGEGTVGIYQSHNRGCSFVLQPRMCQKSPEVLRQIQVFLEGNGVTSRLSYKKRPVVHLISGRLIRQSSIWDLQIHQATALPFLASILPWLIVKKVQVQDVIRFRKLYPPMRPGTEAWRATRKGVSDLEAFGREAGRILRNA